MNTTAGDEPERRNKSRRDTSQPNPQHLGNNLSNKMTKDDRTKLINRGGAFHFGNESNQTRVETLRKNRHLNNVKNNVRTVINKSICEVPSIIKEIVRNAMIILERFSKCCGIPSRSPIT